MLAYQSELSTHYADIRKRLFNTSKPVLPKIKHEGISTPLSTHPARDRMLKMIGRAKDVPRPSHKLKFHIVADDNAYVPQWRRIADEVCEKTGVNYAEIRSHRRDRHLVRARHECMWRLSKETTLSLPQMGRLMGGFDHSSVLHAIRAHEKRLAEAVE